MKVITTKESFERKINLRGLGIIPEGVVLDLTETRAKELMGNNSYKLNFVEPLDKPKKEVKEVKEEPKEEPKKAKKK